MVVVSNTSPWTYWGSRPLTPSPEASFDTGLDLFAMRQDAPGRHAADAGPDGQPRADGAPHGRSVARPARPVLASC